MVGNRGRGRRLGARSAGHLGWASPDPPSNALVRFFARRAQLPTVSVDRIVREGDSLAGLRVIATPGHTRGHTSLISDKHGLLFTGDAFGSVPFKARVGVRKFICADPAEAQRSAEKLLREEFSTVLQPRGTLA